MCIKIKKYIGTKINIYLIYLTYTFILIYFFEF